MSNGECFTAVGGLIKLVGFYHYTADRADYRRVIILRYSARSAGNLYSSK